MTATDINAARVEKPAAPDWMQTFSGERFFPLDPDPAGIDIVDIAHALSNICRYGGHAKRFLSVAEHCVKVSECVPAEDALWGLLHDASEAYVGDMIRPLKNTETMRPYREAEDVVQAAVAVRFGLSEVIPASVHEMDTRVLLNERAIAITRTNHPWNIEHLEPAPVTYECWAPAEAERRFLDRYYELVGTPRTFDEGPLVKFLRNALDTDWNIAEAAGHGDTTGEGQAKRYRHQHNAGWVEVALPEKNVRESYDLQLIRSCSPNRMKQESRFKLALLEAEVAQGRTDSQILRDMAALCSGHFGFDESWLEPFVA